MSDKGLERILSEAWGCGSRDEDYNVEDMEAKLRADGWLHEDDKVEGVYRCSLTGAILKGCSKHGLCCKCELTDRLATVKDLIG